jgi:hypothetical protein
VDLQFRIDYLAIARGQRGQGRTFNSTRKEFVMNETSQSELELQVVELGDAKEVTMGPPMIHRHEDNPTVVGQFE